MLATTGILVSVALLNVGDEECSRRVEQQGRNEPKYVGMSGYIVGVAEEADYKKLPRQGWTAPVLEQVGPEKWEPSKTRRLPHKLPVKVVEQVLRHKGFGFYEGLLTIETQDGSNRRERIDAKSFTPAPYWKCGPPVIRTFSGPVLAEVVGGDKVKAVDRDGKWVEVERGAKVFCGRATEPRAQDDELACMTYRKWRYGFGSAPLLYKFGNLRVLY